MYTHDDTNVIRYPDCLPKIGQRLLQPWLLVTVVSAHHRNVLAGDPPDPMNLLGAQADFTVIPQLSPRMQKQ